MRRGILRLLIGTLAAGLSLTSGAATASVRGPDVSSFQHPQGYNIAWSAAHGAGAAFAFVKATEGSNYTNSYFTRDFSALATTHMVRGAYHFARPAAGTANALAQARHYIAATGTLHGVGELPGVLDLEVNGGLSPATLIAWTRAYLGEVQRLTGRTPILYTYPSFWQHQMGNTNAFAGYPLWLASYTTTAHLFGGWRSYTFWQYTDHATLTGLPGPVDMSVFNGTYDQLWALANLLPGSALYAHYRQLVLGRGATGTAVMALQAALGLTVDGQFGPMTAQAVATYQRQHSLPATGQVTAATWAALSGIRIAPVPAPTPSPTPTPRPVAAAGFAGDGRSDILAITHSGDLFLFRGTGTGHLAGAGQRIGRGWGRFIRVLSGGDLTGDGHPDLVAITATGDMLLYPGNGRGGFLGAARTIGRGWNHFTNVFSPGDFTGDGHPDLLATTARGDLLLYRGTGHGTLNPAQVIGHGGWNAFTRVFALPAFDGPGRPDLAAITHTGQLRLHPATRTGGLTGTWRTLGNGWAPMTAVTGSGTFAGPTGVLARTGNGTLRLYPGTGKGTWRPVTTIGPGWNGYSTILTS